MENCYCSVIFQTGEELDEALLQAKTACNEATRAVEARTAIENMGVVGVELPAGSTPTVTKSVEDGAVKLTFGLVPGAAGEPGKPGDRGAPGEPGKDGDPGKDGKTPVRGEDYWTEDDKTEIVEDTVAALEESGFSGGGMGAIESTDYPGCFYREVDGVVEWVNPPMALGVEYRTTERYNGKPVYCKLMNCGALTANTAKTTTACSNNGDKVMRAECVALYKSDSWYAAPYNDTKNNLTFIANGLMYNNTEIRVGLIANFNSTQSYATVYYTKNTD